MGKSHRTAKPSVVASKRLVRQKSGISGLSIVEKAPYPGDIHPIPKRDLNILNAIIPDEYLYGLKSIELRARNSEVGDPFAVYFGDEKRIILYSLPLKWKIDSLASHIRSEILSFGATVSEVEKKLEIDWPDDRSISVWFLFCVYAHELGHHRRFQFAHRDGISYTEYEEILADLHALRIKENYVRLIENKKRRGSQPVAGGDRTR